MKKIMVVVTNTEKSHFLLQKAILLAPQYLTVLLIDPTEQDSELVTKQLTPLMQASNAKIKFTLDACHLEQGKDLSQLIVTKANKLNADLIILHKQKFSEAPDEIDFVKQLLRDANRAKLLFCYEKKWNKQPNVLCTVDIDESDEQQYMLNDLVFKTGYQAIVPALAAQLHLATVIEIPRLKNEFDIIDPDEVLDNKRSQYKEDLLKFESIHPCGKVKMHITAGIAAKEIPSLAAKQKIDLVIMGNVGRKGIKGFLIGNTAEKTFRTLNCDVLIVNRLSQ